MWTRLNLEDIKSICHYLGILVLFSTVTFAIPLICAIIFQEWDPAYRYLIACGISLFTGSSLMFATLKPGNLSRRQALVITGLSWIILSLIGAIPLVMSYHYATYLDALYDCVSAITTTGTTIVIDIDHMSYADNMFRFLELLEGGIGLVVVVLSLGLFGSGSGISLYNTEARDEHVVPNLINATRFITRIVTINITIGGSVLFVLCLTKGIEPIRSLLDGFWLAISAFVTGGFAPNSLSIMYYHSFEIEIVLIILMILGSISFVLHSHIYRGDIAVIFRDIEIRTMIRWVCVITIVFTTSIVAAGGFSSLPILLRRGAFMIVSAFTTTGLQNVTTNQLNTVLASGAFLTLSIAMAVGGSAGSTSGGIKLKRLGIALKIIKSNVKEVLSPPSAKFTTTYYHLGKQVLDAKTARNILTIIVLYVGTYIAGTLIGVAYGYDGTHALFESITVCSNGGLASISSPNMPAPLVVSYIIMMWAGRLEFVTLIALITDLFVNIFPVRILRSKYRKLSKVK